MTSSDIVPSILITHQILNIIQGGVVQHVPQSAKARVGRRKRALAGSAKEIVDDSDYKRICLSLLHALWNSSIISDSIHLISLFSWMNLPYC